MERTTSADGVTIAYEPSGNGPPLLIVNGAFGTAAVGAPIAALLHEDFTVVRYDRRGRGGSGDIGDTSADVVTREVADIAAVVDAVGGEAFVFGHSSGGALALEAAATGLHIGGVVVHEPPYVPGPGTSPQAAAELARLVAAGEREEATRMFLRGTGMPEEMVQRSALWDGWSGMVALAHTLPYDVHACNEGVVPAERLARIGGPVLATAGSLSPGWAQAAVTAIAGAAPHGEARRIEGQAHGLAPDVLAAILREFLLG